MIFTIQSTSSGAPLEEEKKVTAEPDLLYCKNHPNTETLLRCNKCNEPICVKCSVQTSVGYRCKECIRTVQNNYFNAESMDYPIVFLVSMLITAVISPIAAQFLGRLGLFFVIIIMMLIGSGAGSLLAQVVRRAVGNRRGRYLRQFMLAGVVVGLLLGALLGLLFGVWVLNLPTLIFAIFTVVTAYQLLR